MTTPSPSSPSSSCPQRGIDKGKRRAEEEPTERTPLLQNASTSGHPGLDLDAVQPLDSQRRLRSTLTTVFLVSLSICVLALVFIAIMAWTYASRAASLKPEDIIQHDLTFAGPDSINVIRIHPIDGYFSVRVRGRIGMDAGSAIGIGSKEDDGILKGIWKGMGKWGVEALDRVTVNMSRVTVRSAYDDNIELVQLDMSPVEVPLTVDPPKGLGWLTELETVVDVRLVANSSVLTQYLKESWKTGSFAVRADVGEAFVRGGSVKRASWRNKFRAKLTNIRTALQMKIPSFPGFPEHPSFSHLVTLTSFNVTSNSTDVIIHARASALSPLPPSFSSLIPSLPFTISVTNPNHTFSIPVASVLTSPSPLTHPNITLEIQGKVLPLTHTSFPLLSHFVTNYLSGEANDVSLSSPYFPNFHVDAKFPAPNPRPRILRNVTIRDMRIKPYGSAFLASGTVYARVVLPKGMNVGLDVFRVLPDVLIFDGEVPDDVLSPSSSSHLISPSLDVKRKKGHHDPDPDLPPEPPLPSPLPEHAFGHIRPEDWLASVSEPVNPDDDDWDDDEGGSAYAVQAEVVDAPIKVLPGRQKEFSNFVGKVIFGSEGALAGILGEAAVTVAVEGLPLSGPGRKRGEVVLSSLPFQGSVIIGKKSM